MKSKDSLLKPLLTTWGRAHEESAPWMWKPISSFNKCCCDGEEKKLCYCGFSFILIPLQIVYAGIVASVQVAIAVIFASIGLALGVLFTMVGIWPAIILAFGITGLTIVTLPMNIYYHALVTYR